jgi:DNA-binding CsgD family transcriptional regulator
MAGRRSASGGLVLVGRRIECAVLEDLLDGARAGRSGALVVRGEAGVGKTALLQYATESASDMSVTRAVGVESERVLAFAALHQLCVPLLLRLDRLPGPQRDALAITFGLSAGAAPDRFLVGLAVLGLLSEAAEERPLVCVVDDAHWLDRASAQALAFVARRLLAESVVLVFAAREPTEELRGLPELVVDGLRDTDARELLASVIPGRLDERVGDQVVTEMRGNPLALIELTRGVSPADLAGGFGLPGALSLEGRIEERFLARLEALPPDTRRLLLVAAAEPVGDPGLVWKAATQMAIAGSALEPAVGAGLLEVGPRVSFRHPLVRSAVYRAASPELRREAHRALAEATDPMVDPDRRAWHLAEATAGPDEEVAAELERSAARAQARGGLAAAAAFQERAVALTADPPLRTERALAAAQTKIQAGALDAVHNLLATAETGPLSELQHARADLVRAELAFVASRGGDSVLLFVSAAKQLEAVAPELARATYLDAFVAANLAGRFAPPGGSLLAVARATSATTPSHASSPAGLLVDGLAANFTQGYTAGLPILRRAVKALGAGEPADEGLRGMALAFVAAAHVWDDDDREAIAVRWATGCRDAGALGDLPLALNAHALVLLFAGDLRGAASLIEEVQAAQEATGIHIGPWGATALAAFRGNESEATPVIEASIADASLRREGSRLAAGEWAKAVLNNGLGRYEQALAAAERASEHDLELGYTNTALIELIEAAARSEVSETAVRAYRRLVEMTSASATEWALGIEARSRALLSDGEVAEGLHREAIERLGRTRLRVELARAHLLYGEWLRREHRRVDAREQLRTAHQMFTTMGVEAFAERAGRELLATGEHVRKRVAQTRDDLTAQEGQIARLARDGVSNADIAARLFISRRTVEYHLSKVFNKLGIRSRHELDRVLPPEPPAVLAC